tara:strand:+ start:219 stop:665 length:447 start_codon:yes stop_codon:yes gene_type:complete
MAKPTTKKKFSLFKMFNPKPQTLSEGYAQLAGAQIKSKGNYKSPKTGLQQAKDDFLMDIGVKEKDQDYYARIDDRAKRSQQAMEDMKERRRKKNRRRRRGETAAEREARLKREALAKQRAEGQTKRKKFYKEKDERLAKLKAKLLNLT